MVQNHLSWKWNECYSLKSCVSIWAWRAEKHIYWHFIGICTWIFLLTWQHLIIHEWRKSARGNFFSFGTNVHLDSEIRRLLSRILTELHTTVQQDKMMKRWHFKKKRSEVSSCVTSWHSAVIPAATFKLCVCAGVHRVQHERHDNVWLSFCLSQWNEMWNVDLQAVVVAACDEALQQRAVKIVLKWRQRVSHLCFTKN